MYLRRMIHIETNIRIARAREDVFALLSDPPRFPLWNSAVTAVDGTGPSYVMHRSLPTGPAENGLEVVERNAPTRFAVRTTSIAQENRVRGKQGRETQKPRNGANSDESHKQPPKKMVVSHFEIELRLMASIKHQDTKAQRHEERRPSTVLNGRRSSCLCALVPWCLIPIETVA